MARTPTTKKSLIQAYAPIFIGFMLSSVTSTYASYRMLESLVNENSAQIRSLNKENAVFALHMQDFGRYKIQTELISQAMKDASKDRSELQEVIKKLDGTINTMNTTLTTVTTTYGKDIEYVKLRLDKAGI